MIENLPAVKPQAPCAATAAHESPPRGTGAAGFRIAVRGGAGDCFIVVEKGEPPPGMAVEPTAQPEAPLEAHRTYDADRFRRRAGCLALLPPSADGAPPSLVLASSSSKPGRWVVPAGGIDHGETPEEAAVREAHEEAGVRARPGSARLLCWVDNAAKRTRTALFFADVAGLDDAFPESHLRTRTCVSIADAEALLAPSSGQLAVLRAGLAAARTLGLLPPAPPDARGTDGAMAAAPAAEVAGAAGSALLG